MCYADSLDVAFNDMDIANIELLHQCEMEMIDYIHWCDDFWRKPEAKIYNVPMPSLPQAVGSPKTVCSFFRTTKEVTSMMTSDLLLNTAPVAAKWFG